jgi:hypothetical protein
VFLACSADCLDRHLGDAHGPAAAAAGVAARVGADQRSVNRERRGREPYAPHRERVDRLLRAAQRGDGLCVLGAGNGDDLDLPGLVREFGEVHLVDLDGEALGRAVELLPRPARDKVVLHAGLDLSGVVDRIDAWGDRFPDAAQLAALGDELSRRIARTIGRSFDVVLSACLLSQLPLPLRDRLVLGLDDWQRLFEAIERAHLTTVAALCRPGGTGVLAVDVTSSRKLPELEHFAAPWTWADLEPTVRDAMARRRVTPSPDPARLLRWLTDLEQAGGVERPRLTDPWVWDSGGGVLALVYGLVFSRA